MLRNGHSKGILGWPTNQGSPLQRIPSRPGRFVHAGRWRTPALLAASMAGVALATYWVLWGAQPAVTVLQTPAGQNQAFILADGSRLNLGASTRLEIKLEARARDINLVRGEAFFPVAKDRDRPFTVHAGDATVTAVGTEFSVNRGADQVVVAVIEGRVLVGS